MLLCCSGGRGKQTVPLKFALLALPVASTISRRLPRCGGSLCALPCMPRRRLPPWLSLQTFFLIPSLAQLILKAEPLIEVNAPTHAEPQHTESWRANTFRTEKIDIQTRKKVTCICFDPMYTTHVSFVKVQCQVTSVRCTRFHIQSKAVNLLICTAY